MLSCDGEGRPFFYAPGKHMASGECFVCADFCHNLSSAIVSCVLLVYYHFCCILSHFLWNLWVYFLNQNLEAFFILNYFDQ